MINEWKANIKFDGIKVQIERLIRKHPIWFSLLVFTFVLIIINMVFKGSIIDRLKEHEGLLSTLTATYWSAIIGGLISGGITLLGVLMSNHRQDQVFKETQRLSNMPVLHFRKADNSGKVIYSLSEFNMRRDYETLKLEDKEPIELIITSTNNAFGLKLSQSITKPNKFEDQVLNVDDWFVDNQSISSSQPAVIPIDIHFESKEPLMLYGALRFEYEDVFGNKYYQDLVYEFSEITYKQMKSMSSQLAFFEYIMQGNNLIGKYNVLKNYGKESFKNLVDEIKMKLNNLDINEHKAIRTFHIVSVPAPILASNCISDLESLLEPYELDKEPINNDESNSGQ